MAGTCNYSYIVQLALEPLAVGALRRCAAVSRDCCVKALLVLRGKRRWLLSDYRGLRWKDLQVLLKVPQHLETLYLPVSRLVPEAIGLKPRRLQEATELVRDVVICGSSTLDHVEVCENCFRDDNLCEAVGFMREFLPVACRLRKFYTEAHCLSTRFSEFLAATRDLEVLVTPNISLALLLDGGVVRGGPRPLRLDALRELHVKGPCGSTMADLKHSHGSDNPFEVLRRIWPSLQKVVDLRAFSHNRVDDEEPFPLSPLAAIFQDFNPSVSRLKMLAGRLDVEFTVKVGSGDLFEGMHGSGSDDEVDDVFCQC